MLLARFSMISQSICETVRYYVSGMNQKCSPLLRFSAYLKTESIELNNDTTDELASVQSRGPNVLIGYVNNSSYNGSSSNCTFNPFIVIETDTIFDSN